MQRGLRAAMAGLLVVLLCGCGLALGAQGADVVARKALLPPDDSDGGGFGGPGGFSNRPGSVNTKVVVDAETGLLTWAKASPAYGSPDAPPLQLPGESTAAYLSRLSNAEMLAALHAPTTTTSTTTTLPAPTTLPPPPPPTTTTSTTTTTPPDVPNDNYCVAMRTAWFLTQQLKTNAGAKFEVLKAQLVPMALSVSASWNAGVTANPIPEFVRLSGVFSRAYQRADAAQDIAALTDALSLITVPSDPLFAATFPAIRQYTREKCPQIEPQRD
ncbi:MAG: hypothetical protein U0Q22_02745 [Acidimicrobiales bacterium]